jgi:hypothetical protein
MTGLLNQSAWAVGLRCRTFVGSPLSLKIDLRESLEMPWPACDELGASIFWVNAETSFADTEGLIIGWQTRRDLQRRGIVEVVEHDSE